MIRPVLDPLEAVRLARQSRSLRLAWFDPLASEEARVLHEIIGWMLASEMTPHEIAEILLRAGLLREALVAGRKLRRQVKTRT